eukprot:6173706-Pleurochrysis_carterae.AAC.1
MSVPIITAHRMLTRQGRNRPFSNLGAKSIKWYVHADAIIGRSDSPHIGNRAVNRSVRRRQCR